MTAMIAPSEMRMSLIRTCRAHQWHRSAKKSMQNGVGGYFFRNIFHRTVKAWRLSSLANSHSLLFYVEHGIMEEPGFGMVSSIDLIGSARIHVLNMEEGNSKHSSTVSGLQYAAGIRLGWSSDQSVEECHERQHKHEHARCQHSKGQEVPCNEGQRNE